MTIEEDLDVIRSGLERRLDEWEEKVSKTSLFREEEEIDSQWLKFNESVGWSRGFIELNEEVES